MPQKPSFAESLTTQDSRGWIQYNGARPNNPVGFYGISAPYNIITGVVIPINGQVTNQWIPSRKLLNKYEIARRTIAPPPIAAATLTVLEKAGTLNRFLAQDCNLSAYLLFGACADLSNFLYGWTTKVKIFADGIVGSINEGNQGEWNNENLLQDQIPLSLREIYEIGQMGFGTVGASEIVTEVIDVVYGQVARCGNCGEQNDGTQWIYAVTKRMSSSVGDPAEVVYSVDGGNTWTVLAIAGIATNVDPAFIDIAGTYLIVGVTAEDAYYYANINQTTGVPGAFTKVTTGFVSTHGPTDSYVANGSEIYFSGEDGYIYKSTNIPQGVTPVTAGGVTTANLLRIAGDGNNTIVAVGATGVVVISINNGQSWALAGDSPANTSLTALTVLDNQRYWVGDNSGDVYYTLNGAASWTEMPLTDSPAQINDIEFLNNEVGWIVAQTSAPAALVYSTWNGGNLWTANAAAPRMFGVPSTNFQKANRVAIPYAATTQVAANTVVIAGLGESTDGILVQGQATYL